MRAKRSGKIRQNLEESKKWKTINRIPILLFVIADFFFNSREHGNQLFRSALHNL